MKQLMLMWNKMPMPFKLLSVAIVCVLGFVVFRTVWNVLRQLLERLGLLSGSKLHILPPGASYTISDYNAFADKLYNAFNSAGTDETAVTEVFTKLRNSADWLALVAAYGSRNTGLFPWSDTTDLRTALSEELDTAELNRVRLILGGIGVSI